ncbi:PQQ-binding-like beta-propeller repeat protein [Nocardioides ferulae]|uniref:outer membrane protein assembly factor BamB family protein n=1 Tax=Nocardioides ferulae TaxID=2340821 RepID=UPI0013DE40AD|nr:PQQ-binding-like beta-propeller repeat protein [Nocardioides ferulae]
MTPSIPCSAVARHRSARRLLAIGLVALLATPLLAACTGDDPDPDGAEAEGTAATAPSPAPLEELWLSGRVSDATSLTLRPGPADASILVLSDDRDRVVGLDAETGEQRWQWSSSPDRVCQTSPRVNRAGVLAVLTDRGPGDCTQVVALDTTTGEETWRRRVPGRPPYLSASAVAVSRRTVLVEAFCDEVLRYAAGSGRSLDTLAPRDRKCAMESALGDGLVAVMNDPETASTPDDHGTGWIPATTDRVTRDLYDADTGRLLWRAPMSNAGGSIDQVVSTDPLVLVWTRRGQQVGQVFDRRGRPRAVVGLRMPGQTGGLVAVGEHDGVLAVQHTSLVGSSAPRPYATTTYAYDVATGEELWRQEPELGVPAGVVDGSVVFARVVQVLDPDAATGRRYEMWLTARDLAAPEGAAGAVRTLGSVAVRGAASTVVGLAGDALLLADDEGVHAVPVDGDGEERVYAAPADPRSVPESEWAEGEVRPEDARDVCRAVDRETLAGLGFRALELPAPVDCSWRELHHPRYLTRVLDVHVTVLEPGPEPGAEEIVGATERAQRYAESVVQGFADDEGSGRERSTGWSVDAGVEGGPGEVTWSALALRYGLESVAVTRWRNVVVQVRAGQEVDVEERRPASVPGSALSWGVRAAVDDVLRELGAEDPAAPSPVVAPWTEVPDVCTVLGAEAEALVGSGGQDTSPRIQDPAPASYCQWGARLGSPSVKAAVQLFADDPLDGAAASEVAAERFGLAARGRRVPGLGDRAVVRADGFGGQNPALGLLVRDQNAVIQVDFWRVPGIADERDAVARATAMARRLLRELRG